MVQVARSLALVALVALALPALAPAGSAGPIPDCFANFPPCPPAPPSVGVPSLPSVPAAPQVPGAPAVPVTLPQPDLGDLPSSGDQVMAAAGEISSHALPSDGQSLLLVGDGTAYSMRDGQGQVCGGAEKMVLEASNKPFNLEPIVTMSYSGGSGQGALAEPCAQGEQRQPAQSDITGTFDGAWHAFKNMGIYWWSLDVSAPHGDGSRDVSFYYTTPGGLNVDSFQGTLQQYR
jgi:hypothetical protein